MELEENRLATFSMGWPHPASFAGTPVKFAKAGFYFDPTPQYRDKVLCFCCGLSLVDWKRDHDPWNEHCKRAPTCGFINRVFERYKSEAARLSSFASWPLSRDYRPNPSRLAAAGFYFSPTHQAPDRAACFCCGISLYRWEAADDPWTEHQKHSRNCPLVQGRSVGNIPLSDFHGAASRAAAAPAAASAPARGAAALSSSSSSAEKPTVEGDSSPNPIPALIERLEALGVDPNDTAPSFFVCPITLGLITNPVVAEDGHSYERESIEQWLTSRHNSPLTNKPIYSKRLIVNYNLRAQIVDFLEKLIASTKEKANQPADVASSPSASASASLEREVADLSIS